MYLRNFCGVFSFTSKIEVRIEKIYYNAFIGLLIYSGLHYVIVSSVPRVIPV
jgi:hypothetical protein